MLISQKELKNIIKETKEFINEGYGSSPCPISTANQLHSSGATEPDLQDFINCFVNDILWILEYKIFNTFRYFSFIHGFIKL